MLLLLARETGWSYDFIRRRLPFAAAMQLYHAAIWGNGAWTIRRERKPAETLFPAPQQADAEEDWCDE